MTSQIGLQIELSEPLIQELEKLIRRVLAEQKPAEPALVGALTKAQTAKFLGYKKTRFNELLKEHPELDAMAVTFKTTSNGRKYRRWPVDGLKAWLERNPRVLDEAA